MFDVNGLPSIGSAETFIYQYGTMFAITLKPKWQYVMMFTLGAGAGGDAGQTRVSGTTANGGAGGGAGGWTTLLVPRIFLPDIIYVTVGTGGIGGNTSAGNGTAGTNTIFSTSGNTIILATGIGGSNAVGTSGGVGGSGLIGFGVCVGSTGNGDSGSATSSTANASDITPIAFVCGGTGGGGLQTTTPFNGGNIIASGLIPALAGGIGGNGNPGFQISRRPLLGIGGTGGGANDASPGGNGGDAIAFGCGGGGGGSGTVFGRGGNGGPGLAMLWGW